MLVEKRMRKNPETITPEDYLASALDFGVCLWLRVRDSLGSSPIETSASTRDFWSEPRLVRR
jgi:hypothetical protein